MKCASAACSIADVLKSQRNLALTKSSNSETGSTM
jgi:hypothetical protein